LLLLAKHAGADSKILQKMTAAALFKWAKKMSVGTANVSTVPPDVYEQRAKQDWSDNDQKPASRRNKKTKDARIVPAAADTLEVPISSDEEDAKVSNEAALGRNFTWSASPVPLATISAPKRDDINVDEWIAWQKIVC
jgi:hypothetical protein